MFGRFSCCHRYTRETVKYSTFLREYPVLYNFSIAAGVPQHLLPSQWDPRSISYTSTRYLCWITDYRDPHPHAGLYSEFSSELIDNVHETQVTMHLNSVLDCRARTLLKCTVIDTCFTCPDENKSAACT